LGWDKCDTGHICRHENLLHKSGHNAKILAMSLADLVQLGTEQAGTEYPALHSMTVGEIVEAMNDYDKGVAEAVHRELASIEGAIEAIVERMSRGGRLIYVGAGTSGRLAVLDASECPPTFNANPDQVIGIIAGGEKALTSSIEGAEDSTEEAVRDMNALSLKSDDCVIGIAASGRTPYVIAALMEASQKNCLTVGISCNKASSLSDITERNIEVDCGAEILAGSTRLKAGTATKMILNMISTISMVKLGKVYMNLMVDLKVTNEKLHARAISIIVNLVNVSEDVAEKALEEAEGSVRYALVILVRKVPLSVAQEILLNNQNDLAKILETNG
jgi:N-acetylmuramic acid 6-phosphate etherase